MQLSVQGMNLIWEWIPEHFAFPYYTIAVCVIGAFLIGIFRKVYDYKNMLVMMIAAVLPLLIGSSVGPEAGLTGIIVGMCAFTLKCFIPCSAIWIV